MDYKPSNSQQRILKIIMVLAGHEMNGLAPGEIAKAVGCIPSDVTGSMKNLKFAGLAEQVPDMGNRWRLAPRVIQIALAYMNNIEKAESRLNETKNRFTRIPK